MDMILKDLKAKSDLLQFDIDTLMKVLNEQNVATFELNPRIAEITNEIADLKKRKDKVDKEIIEYTKKLEDK